MPILTAASSGVVNAPVSDVLAEFKLRLSAASVLSEDRIRVCAVPADRMAEYLAQQGLVIRVDPPQPTPGEGHGRYGANVHRTLEVFVVTMNLSDPAGSDERAVILHTAREEAVVNALLLDPPPGSGYGHPVGKLIRWMPGGYSMTRQVGVDPGLIVSSLPFDVLYPLNCSVLRT